jgi:WD40 repeat protein
LFNDVLPNEMLHAIFGFLNERDLYSASRVCRSWRQIEIGKWVNVQTLFWHTRSLSSLAILPDGALVSGSVDGYIKICQWNNGLWNCIVILKGHNNQVSSLVALQNNIFASASIYEKDIKIWHLGQNIQSLTGHQKGILALCVLSDATLVSSSRDKTIKFWYQINGKYQCIQTYLDKTEVCYLGALTDGSLVSWALHRDFGLAFRLKFWRRSEEQFQCTEPQMALVDIYTCVSDGTLARSEDGKITFWRPKDNLAQYIQTLTGTVWRIIRFQEHSQIKVERSSSNFITSITSTMPGGVLPADNCVQTYESREQLFRYPLITLPNGILAVGVGNVIKFLRKI